jgi:RNA polymerase sigma factor (TIGR02999 family)
VLRYRPSLDNRARSQLRRGSLTRTSSTRFVELLAEARRGQPDAIEAIFEATYAQLRRIAGALMRRERPGHTLQPTDLVHNAWLKMVDQSTVQWTDRAHFLNIAGRAMRQILVDHARRRGADKRLAGVDHVTFNDEAGHGADAGVEVLELHDALDRFTTVDPRAAQVVQARVFGGMNVREVAHVLNVSTRTVELDWTLARRWLARELRGRA